MPSTVDKRTSLVVASLASFLTPFMGSSINVALPAIGREFGMDAILLSWVPTSYLLASAILLVPFGRIADVLGKRRVFLYGIALYTVSSTVCALASGAWLLLAGRVLQGISGSMMFGISIAILTSTYPADERGRALGFNSAAVYVGLSVGPFIGGFLTGFLGWRSIFLLQIPLGLLMIGLVLWKLKLAEHRLERMGFDYAGSTIYSVSLLALLYGFSILPSTTGVILTGTGIAGLLGFLSLERRRDDPILDVGLFARNRVFAFSNLAAFITYSATFAVTFLLSIYLQVVRGYSPQEAGTILVVQPVLMAAGSPFAGRLSDRIEPRIVASIGMAVMVPGLLFFAFLHEATPLWMIIGSLALFGFGFALFSSPNTNAVMGSVSRSTYGVAAGTLATMRMTGQTFSLGIAMVLFALHIGNARISEAPPGEIVTSLNVAFLVFSALELCGVFASLARGDIHAPAGVEGV